MCYGDVNDFVWSRSTLYRSWKTNRLKIIEFILNRFGKGSSKNVAWHGKLAKNWLSNNFEALVVIASSKPHHKNGKSLEFKKLQTLLAMLKSNNRFAS